MKKNKKQPLRKARNKLLETGQERRLYDLSRDEFAVIMWKVYRHYCKWLDKGRRYKKIDWRPIHLATDDYLKCRRVLKAFQIDKGKWKADFVRTFKQKKPRLMALEDASM